MLLPDVFLVRGVSRGDGAERFWLCRVLNASITRWLVVSVQSREHVFVFGCLLFLSVDR